MRASLARSLTLGALLAPVPLFAQNADSGRSAGTPAAGSATLPAGWQARLDRVNARLEAVKLVAMAPGFHFTTGPSGIFWQPSANLRGEYVMSASFTQTKPSAHPEAYGLFVGGRNLQGEAPEYLYFVIRQDGKYTVKHRANATEVHTIVDWTAHPAIRAIPDSGSVTNQLSIRSTADSVVYFVNGAPVRGFDRSHMTGTDGFVGVRMNHNLDVHVSPITVTPLRPSR